MKKREELRYQRATAVRTFGEDRAAEFPAGTKATDLFAALARQIASLNVAMADQIPARIDKAPLLKKLKDDSRKIARTARAIGIDTDDTSFATPYRMPGRPGETALLTHIDAVRSLLQDQPGDTAATQQTKSALRFRFVAYELPPDFIDALSQRADALRSASRINQGENQDGVENTMRIGQLLDDTSDTIRQLNAIMINKYAAEPEKLRAWKTASRIERMPQRTKAAAVATVAS